MCVGLAVYPTWIVARETQPVEEQTDEGSAVNNESDVDAGKDGVVGEVTSLDAEDKAKFATARSSVGAKD